MTTLSDPYESRPYVLDRESAPAFWLVATLWLAHATCFQTGNRFSLMEQWMPTGLGPPTHRHQFANEGFYVLEGTVAYNAQGATVHAGPGTFVHLPRLLPHSFSVDTSQAHVLNFYAPGGFELVVLAAGRPAGQRRMPSMEESLPPNPDEIRVLSRIFGQEEVEALPFAQPTEAAMMRTEAGAWSIGSLVIRSAGDVAPVEAFGMSWRVLGASGETDGTYDLSEVAVPAGAGMPPRRLGQDEAVYVLGGGLDVVLDGQGQRAEEGAFVYLPRGSTGAWSATTTSRVLVFHLPAGFDQALTRQPDDQRHVRAFLEATGTRFLPPS